MRHGDMTERAVDDLVVNEVFWQTFERAKRAIRVTRIAGFGLLRALRRAWIPFALPSPGLRRDLLGVNRREVTFARRSAGPCPRLLARASIDRVGYDHRAEHPEEHGRLLSLTFATSATTLALSPSCEPGLAQGASKPPVRSPQLARTPRKALSQRARPGDLILRGGQQPGLLAVRLLGGRQSYLRRRGRLLSAAGDQCAQRRAAEHQCGDAQHGYRRDPWALPGRAHHASCSATASPSRLMASRVGRSSAARV